MKKTLISLLLIITTPVIAIMIFLRSAEFGGKPTASDLQRFSSSPQFNVQKAMFENRRPDLLDRMRNDMSLPGALLKWFETRKDGRPTMALPQVQTDVESLIEYSDISKVIWLGHSSFLLSLESQVVLVDPVFSESAAPVSFTAKRFQPAALSLHELPDIDVVLISHDHYDHLDRRSIQHFTQSQTRFLVPTGVGLHLIRWGIDPSRIVELNWWESHQIDKLIYTAAPAQHFSGRDGINNNQTLWASWVINSQQQRLFFSGDSGYDTHFKVIGDTLGPFNVAFLENGQYDESWEAVHLLPRQTIRAFEELNATHLLPVHWGMFELAYHTWYDPVDTLATLMDERGYSLLTPRLGELLIINEAVSTTRWWKDLYNP